jgi:hypothetical protein
LKLGAEVQGPHGLTEEVGGDAGIDESAEKHISADAGEAFDVGDTHEKGTGPIGFLCRVSEEVSNPSS